ncbi:substrate-binding domain-containing protein [Streptomyces sp. NPDC058683]|uniref:substrate-binding domain-containing protein n=1 Tax=Streptomyces sp. NPDC058683 TaxID=3346597 RepID=UPI0036651258
MPFGAEAAMRLTAADNRPTALRSVNHEATFGALGALVQLGVRVPEQLSLMCHEEAPWFPYWHPPSPLSTAEPATAESSPRSNCCAASTAAPTTATPARALVPPVWWSGCSAPG